MIILYIISEQKSMNKLQTNNVIDYIFNETVDFFNHICYNINIILKGDRQNGDIR